MLLFEQEVDAVVDDISKRKEIQNIIKQYVCWLESIDISKIKNYKKLCHHIRKIDGITRSNNRNLIDQEMIEKLLICRKIMQDRQDELRFNDSLNLR